MSTLPMADPLLDSEFDEIEACLSILNDTLQPSNAISPAVAANRINELIPLKDGDDISGVDGFFWGIWEAFIEVAGQTPHDHPSQQKLVQVIEELNSTTCRAENPGGTHVWAELHRLGPSMREAWIDPISEEQVKEFGSHWINLNAFAARLVNAGLAQWKLFFIWSMRTALEKPKPQGPLLDCHVAAAAAWIAYGGSVLFKQITNEELSARELQLTAGGSLYNGRLGLSL
ncbi:MAG: hypothetical protein M1840_007923 [Geoglossum simile]|nr:MAG: hypothetical protein M1840_007923 [Geoglossum simile]